MRFPSFPILALLLAFALAAPAGAAEPKVIGTFRDWSAHVFDDGKTRICYLYSEPKKEAGDYTRRGDAYVQVAMRPAENVKDEVSVTAGYTYKDNSEVTIEIGSHSFALFTDQDNAWARDSKTDAALVAAMKAGANMVVKGVSRFGTLTTDTYSLIGFTNAHRAMERACR